MVHMEVPGEINRLQLLLIKRSGQTFRCPFLADPWETHGHPPVPDSDISGKPVAEFFFQQMFMGFREFLKISVTGDHDQLIF